MGPFILIAILYIVVIILVEVIISLAPRTPRVEIEDEDPLF